jgi:hypothetical protein
MPAARPFRLRVVGRSEPARNAPSPEHSFVRRLYLQRTVGLDTPEISDVFDFTFAASRAHELARLRRRAARRAVADNRSPRENPSGVAEKLSFATSSYAAHLGRELVQSRASSVAFGALT